MLVTTIDHVPGYRVTRVIGEVLGLTLRVNDKYSEGIKDPEGHSETRLNQLVATRLEAVQRMTVHAGQLGANAVIGMRFDHRQIAGDFNEIVAYGTGVVIIPAGDDSGTVAGS